MEFQCKEDMYVVGMMKMMVVVATMFPHQVVFSFYYHNFLPKALFFTLKKNLIVIVFFQLAWIPYVNTYLDIIHVGLAVFGF